MSDIESLVISLSNSFTKIISIEEIMANPSIFWGGNGVGDRFAGKRFNYTVIYRNKAPKTYSENDEVLNQELMDNFLKNFSMKRNGIIGIYVHSKKTNIQTRPIRKNILETIKKRCCVVCGSFTDIVCDHKNDLYNDEKVLSSKEQTLEDFQALCNHCNLQKRQVRKQESLNQKIYSAKNLPIYKAYNFEFPWEKKFYDEKDVNLKIDTFWYDPVEFNRKLYIYTTITLVINNQIKKRFS